MPIDTSIYNALMKPRSVADYQAEYDQQDIRKQTMQRNALMLQEGQQKQAQYERDMQDSAKLRNALALPPGASFEDRANAAYSSGVPAGYELAGNLRKQMLEEQKAKTEALMKFYDFQGKAAARVIADPRRETAAAAVAQARMIAKQLGLPVDLSADEAEVNSMQTPEQFYRWAAGHALTAEKMLSKTEIRNLGGADQAITTDFTGKTTPGQVFTKTQTPDSVASERSAAANRALTMRGQDMTDARARESNAPAGKAPPGYRFTPEGNLEAIPGGPADRKNTDAGIREQRAKDASMAQADRVLAKVDEAMKGVGVLTAGPGAMLAGLPGTSARNLQSTLETIKANLGFAELQAMRDASPTGGALGAIAVQELMALQATVASLDQGQSPEKLKKSLGDIQRHYNNWKATISGDAAAPSAPADGGLTPEEKAELDALRKRFGK